jgi:hypothetical protein
MPYGDVARVGGGCGPLRYLNGQENFYFVRGVTVRRIGPGPEGSAYSLLILIC